MKENPQVLISSREAAEMLGKDARTIQRMAVKGEIPATKLPGLRGSYVFNRSDVEALLVPASHPGDAA